VKEGDKVNPKHLENVIHEVKNYWAAKSEAVGKVKKAILAHPSLAV
jgi:hypothetical protein